MSPFVCLFVNFAVNPVSEFTDKALREVERITHSQPKFSNEELVEGIERQKSTIALSISNSLADKITCAITDGIPMSAEEHAGAAIEEFLPFLSAHFLQSLSDMDREFFCSRLKQPLVDHLTEFLKSCKIIQTPSSEAERTHALSLLNLTQPFYAVCLELARMTAEHGLTDKLSLAKKEGTCTMVYNTYHDTLNNIELNKARVEAITKQTTLLTVTVTDLDNEPSHRKLVIMGLGPILKTQATPRDRDARALEAKRYMEDLLKLKQVNLKFSLFLMEPRHAKSQTLGVLELNLKSDRFAVERVISQLRSEGKTNIRVRRHSPSDNPSSNLPGQNKMSEILKLNCKQALHATITEMVNNGRVQEAENIRKLHEAKIIAHDFKVRKCTQAQKPTVYYEFLCPLATSTYMTYKGYATFEDYDFTDENPNPRVRNGLAAGKAALQPYALPGPGAQASNQ